MTSILTSSKNDPYVFCSTLHDLSNAVYRFSMRGVVLENSRGAEINPPPAGSRLAQTPAGARVNLSAAETCLWEQVDTAMGQQVSKFWECIKISHPGNVRPPDNRSPSSKLPPPSSRARKGPSGIGHRRWTSAEGLCEGS